MKLKEILNNYSIYLVFFLQILMMVIFYIHTKINIISMGFLVDLIYIYIINFLIFRLLKGKLNKLVYSVYMLLFVILLNIDVLYFDNYKQISRVAAISSIKWLESSYGLSISLVGWILIILGILSAALVILSNKVIKHKCYFYVFIGLVVFYFVFNIRMAFRPDFNTFLEYHDSAFYLYDKIPDTLRFSEKFGYLYYHIIDLFRSI